MHHNSTCMHELYDETKPLYLETDAYGLGLGARLLQTRYDTSCPRGTKQKDCSHWQGKVCPTQWRDTRGPLGTLHGLDKFHHYCFAREVSIITDHKPLVAIFRKDMATVLQRLQQILLRIHQYRVKIIYMPGPDLVIAYWLSRQNHKEDKDEEIAGMEVNINTLETATNIPECMTICELQHKTVLDNNLQQLKECIIKGWQENKDRTSGQTGEYEMTWQ